jgi:hypothetical protein
MKQKQFLILAGLAFLAMIAALMLNRERAPVSIEDGQRKLAPGLDETLNDVNQLTVTGAGNAVLATLKRTDARWVVAEKADYPANVAKVREVLLALANADILEKKTAQKERYATLGVEDVAASDASGVQVELAGGKAPLKLIVGKPATQGSGTFVRPAGEAQSMLVSGAISVPKAAAEWLKKDLLEVAAADVAAVRVERKDGTLSVRKAKREDSNFTVENLPPKREVSSEFAANGLAAFVSGLNFDDVAKRDAEFVIPTSAFTATTDTFDGRRYVAQLWELEGKQQMVISASFDQALVAAPVEPPAPAADADATAKAAHQAAVAKAKADHDAAVAKARAAVDAFNSETGGWIYTIPNFKFAQINKTMADLLKQPEAAAK